VQDEQLIAGRGLDGSDGNAAGQHLSGGLPDGHRPTEPQSDVVALDTDDIGGLEDAVRGVAELADIGPIDHIDNDLAGQPGYLDRNPEEGHAEAGIGHGSHLPHQIDLVPVVQPQAEAEHRVGCAAAQQARRPHRPEDRDIGAQPLAQV